MKFLPLPLLLLIFLFYQSCTHEEPASTPEFSLRDSLKTAIITIEVPDFNESIDPILVLAYWKVWYSQEGESHQLYLDADGRTSFTVEENIIRSYNLIYGGTFLDVVVRPGEDLQLQILRDTVNNSYKLRAPDAPFTDQAAEIIAVLKPPTWPTRDSLTKGITDLDSLMAINKGFAKQRRQRLKNLWESGRYNDPLLLEYANSYIDHQVRYDFNHQALNVHRQLDEDSILLTYLMPNAERSFTEPSIFNAELIEDLHYEHLAVTSLAYAATKHLPKETRKEAYYFKSVRLIDSLYDGYLHDLFLTRIFSLQLTTENPAPQLLSDAEHFVRTTPYPGLGEPIREQLSILAGEAEPVNLYEQQLRELPAGMDNPIPAILAEHAGKVIVLDFWATWCSPCISEMKDDYPAFMKKYDPEQFVVVFLAQSSPENLWRDQISKLEFSAVHLRTNKEQTSVVSKLFGISGIPHHAVFDQQGKLVAAKTDGPGYGLADEVDRLLGL